MIKKLIQGLLFITLPFIYCGCNETKKESKYVISFKFSDEWKTDSLGCLGYRERYVKDSLNVIKKFIGSHIDSFTKYFGDPYLYEAQDKNIYPIYWISCAYIPTYDFADNKMDTLKHISAEDATLMTMEVDDHNIIKDIVVSIP